MRIESTDPKVFQSDEHARKTGRDMVPRVDTVGRVRLIGINHLARTQDYPEKTKEIRQSVLQANMLAMEGTTNLQSLQMSMMANGYEALIVRIHRQQGGNRELKLLEDGSDYRDLGGRYGDPDGWAKMEIVQYFPQVASGGADLNNLEGLVIKLMPGGEYYQGNSLLPELTVAYERYLIESAKISPGQMKKEIELAVAAYKWHFGRVRDTDLLGTELQSAIRQVAGDTAGVFGVSHLMLMRKTLEGAEIARPDSWSDFARRLQSEYKAAVDRVSLILSYS